MSNQKDPLIEQLQHQRIPGQDPDLRPDKAIDYTEMRSRNFNDGPGEMDMLLGFFIMNGACIIFFLAFGLCVICSVCRRRPKFVANDEPSQTAPLSKAPPLTTVSPNSTANNIAFKSKINKLRPKSTKQAPSSNGPSKPAFVAPTPITSPMLKPTFKAIVARAMEQQKLAQKQLTTGNSNLAEKGKSLSVNNSRANSRRGSGSSTNKNDVNQTLLGECVEDKKPDQVSVQIEDDVIETPNQNQLQSNHIIPDLNSNPKSPVGAVKQQTHEDETETASTGTSCDEETPSVVRQNLLGALTWDDLYYA